MPEIFQKLVTLLDFASGWFDQYIIASAGGFLRAVGTMLIAIFQFFIEVIQWVIGHL